MEPLNARVKNGRLVLDAPTDLPDGQVVPMLPLDEILALLPLIQEAAEEAVPDSDGMATIYLPTRRAWKKPKQVNAAALIEELRAL